MRFYLYKIINIINNKIYIGASNNPEKRWKSHCIFANGGKEKYPHHYQALHAAISKYGVNNFVFEVFKEFDNEDACYVEESRLIGDIKMGSVPNYNIAGGGKGTGSGINHPTFGKKLPKEWVNNMKISAANRSDEEKRITAEKHKLNIVERNWVGEKHPMFGKKHSSKTKKLISEKSRGRIVSEETRRKISNRVVSQETRDKLSVANKGKIVSLEARQKLSTSMSGKFIGSLNPNSKLSEKDLIEIKNYFLIDKLSDDDVAIKFPQVKKSTITHHRIQWTIPSQKNEIRNSENYSTLLNWNKVTNIRLDHNSGKPIKTIAYKYSIKYGTIYAIIKNRTWKEK